MYLCLTNATDKQPILINSLRVDFVEKDSQGRAIIINKQQPPLTVCESFYYVIGKLNAVDNTVGKSATHTHSQDFNHNLNSKHKLVVKEIPDLSGTKHSVSCEICGKQFFEFKV